MKNNQCIKLASLLILALSFTTAYADTVTTTDNKGNVSNTTSISTQNTGPSRDSSSTVPNNKDSTTTTTTAVPGSSGSTACETK